MNIDHTSYDEEWQSRAIWKYLKAVKPAVMLVGGWYDTEDPQGLLRQFTFMEQNTPAGRHAGDGTVEPRRIFARRWRSAGQHQFRIEDRGLLSRAHRVAVLSVLPQGARRREISQGVALPDRSEPVAQVRLMASERSQATDLFLEGQWPSRMEPAGEARSEGIPCCRPSQARAVCRPASCRESSIPI
ncbi:MAG: CocE/NonD family hydrolase [Ignavibacteriota bacterium]